ncbi:MAG: RNA-metabolising metallo-beta-lactamase [Mycoplasmataceae bacterium CE_OT135]|nr:MAG: RNA-metabolising metallo-beta-lactamase [Mycoplasmataceae bacterium CE_OT135]
METEHSILLLTAGENAPFLNHQETIDYDYLTKAKAKIKAIILPNTLPKNCALLPQLYQELNLQCPIYGSQHTFLILDYLWATQPKIKDKFIAIEPNKSLKVGEFSLRFLPLNSYVLGNLAVMINYQDYTFYCLQDFILNNLLNNNYLSDTAFFAQLKDLLVHQKKTTYLITAYPNLAWNRQNSLLLAARSWAKEKNYFFLLYDYDWLHIFELCELAQQWQKKIQILNPSFLVLLRKIWKNDKLKEVLVEEGQSPPGNTIYLLVGSPQNIEERLKTILAKKHFSKKELITFVVGISAAHGGEVKIANIVDYLYQKKNEVHNFSRSEAFSLGTSFTDLKLLLEVIQPHLTITLQNSYKQKNYLAYLKKSHFLTCPNQNYLVLPTRKIHPFPSGEWETEKILLAQRQNLLQNGFLVVFLMLKWEQKALKIKNLQLESAAIASTVNWKRLEEKIRHWWERKISPDLLNREKQSNDKNTDFSNQETSQKLPKNWRKRTERYLEVYIERYLNFEHDIEIKSPVILLFLENQSEANSARF